MRNSRLLKLLQTLSQSEFRHFIEYVKSPFFNKNDRLINLIEAIHQSAPDYGEASLAKEELFKVMYGSATYKEQQVHDGLSQLLRLLEGFLAYQKYQDDTPSQYIYLLHALNQKGVDDHFVRIYKKAAKELSKNYQHSTSFYIKDYSLKKVSLEFASQKRRRMSQHAVDTEMLEVNQKLDNFYLLVKLRYACEILNRRNIVQKVELPFMLSEIQQFLSDPENPYAENPAISIYFTIYKLLKNPEDSKNFDQLIYLLEKSIDQFPKVEIEMMYGHAQNYCARKINMGDTSYYVRIFQIYQQLLDNDILIQDGYLAHWYMKNIVTIGLNLKEYKWVESFLNQYERKLHPDVREHTLAFNRANFLFATDRYSEAKVLLNQVEFTDVLYHLSAKSILLKIHYEEKDEDSMSYLIQAFQVFLRRNKHLSKKHYQNHSQFIRLAKKMFQLHTQVRQLKDEKYDAKLSQLEKDLCETPGVAYSRWLKTKMEELKAGRVVL